MKSLIATSILIISLFSFSGCTKPPVIKKGSSFTTYKYAKVVTTSNKTSGYGYLYGNNYNGSINTFGGSSNKSINPSDMISGILIQKGLIIDTDNNKLKPNTLLVNYGETGKRNIAGGLVGYTLGVTIQMVDAYSHEVIYTCSAEGIGETEVDDIREAIKNCLSGL